MLVKLWLLNRLFINVFLDHLHTPLLDVTYGAVEKFGDIFITHEGIIGDTWPILSKPQVLYHLVHRFFRVLHFDLLL